MNLIKQAGHVNHISNADHVGLADHIGLADYVGLADHVGRVGDGYRYAHRFHVGLVNGDSINYYDKSGEIKPFRRITNLVKQSFRMLVSQFYKQQGYKVFFLI